MPELPEVETVRRGLQQLITGRQIAAVWHDTPKSFPNATADVKQFLVGATVNEVRRRAKVLLIELSTEYTLVIHLKMTGQIVFVGHDIDRSASSAADGSHVAPLSAGPDARSAPSSRSQARLDEGAAPPRATRASVASPNSIFHLPNPNEPEARFGAGHPTDSLIGDLPDKSTRVTVTFADGTRLFFNDQRKFGWMKLMPSVEVPNIDFMKKVGPEPLDADFTWGEFAARFSRRARTSIKAALLDQTVVAGVGNIYADESLWGAKIHPKTLVGQIPPSKFQILYNELRAVMNQAIEQGGSTDKNYVDARGKRGSYLTFARAFRREGQPCPRHPGVMIEKIRVAGRGTHICPACQVEQ